MELRRDKMDQLLMVLAFEDYGLTVPGFLSLHKWPHMTVKETFLASLHGVIRTST
jgi:hypothetical protein